MTITKEEVQKLRDGTTPGPWKSSAAAEQLPYGVMPRIYSADGTLLAEVGNVTLGQDAWEANANLFAVAPDLARFALAESARADQAEAAMAAVVERAAKELDERGQHEQINFGLDRATQNFYRARDIVRALAPPSGLAMLAELRASVEKAESHAKSTNGVWQRNLELIAERDTLAAANAALEAKVAGLRDFVDEFAKAKIDALRYSPPSGSSPEDEPDPVVDAETVWAWQADAKAALATQEAGNA